MTIRETYYTVSGMKLWSTAGLILMLVLSSGLALAAQINITNNTETKVAICSYDNTDSMGLTPNQKRMMSGLYSG